MKMSHSKLNCILNNPAEYFLNYVEGIQTKAEKSALVIGSAVHWGIEHNTEDLSEYYNENGTFKQRDNYTRDQLLSEAMVHGYMKHKDELFEQLLTDKRTGKKLNLIEELHEIYLNGTLKSKYSEEGNSFVGIIDLLLLTEEGFILVDYKTSSQVPDWDNYLDQLYRYIYLLKENFPDTPVVKIAIINIRKTNIRQKKNENEFDFLQRMKFEYDMNDEDYINYHEFLPEDLNQNYINDYIENLAKMVDFAVMINNNKLWYINYNNAKSLYGKSDYYDIFYKTPGCEALYTISDFLYDEDEENFIERRDCIGLDMTVLDKDNVLNKYSIFEKELLDSSCGSKEEFFRELAENYSVDKNLLEKYWKTFIKKKEVNNA